MARIPETGPNLAKSMARSPETDPKWAKSMARTPETGPNPFIRFRLHLCLYNPSNPMEIVLELITKIVTSLARILRQTCISGHDIIPCIYTVFLSLSLRWDVLTRTLRPDSDVLLYFCPLVCAGCKGLMGRLSCQNESRYQELSPIKIGWTVPDIQPVFTGSYINFLHPHMPIVKSVATCRCAHSCLLRIFSNNTEYAIFFYYFLIVMLHKVQYTWHCILLSTGIGEKNEMESWHLAGADINQGDYDGRTALHVVR